MGADSNETQALELWAPQEICDAFGWTRTKIKRVRAAGGFPEPLAVVSGGRVAVWDASAVRAWKDCRDVGA